MTKVHCKCYTLKNCKPVYPYDVRLIFVVNTHAMPDQNLYFIALIPHDAVAGEVTGFKNDFAANYSSSRALRTMPHITLKAPFKLEARGHNTLLNWFNGIRPMSEAFT